MFEIRLIAIEPERRNALHFILAPIDLDTTALIAVMRCASLGHTGRQLIATRSMTIACLALTAAALLRGIAPFAGGIEPSRVDSAGPLWSLAFLIFTLQYLLILIGRAPTRVPAEARLIQINACNMTEIKDEH